MRLGVLRNPRATGNRGRPAPALPPGTVLAETSAPEETAAALAGLRRAGVDVVVVDGGDGTVRAAATHLAGPAEDAAPPLAILPHGNTNLVARKLGWLAGAADVHALAAAPASTLAARVTRAAVFRLRFADGRPPPAGFIAGWGAYAAATRIAGQEIGHRHGAQVVAAVAVTLRRTLIGAEAAALRRGVRCELRAPDHPVVRASRFLGIATTLPGPLVAGLEPFWGEGEGPLRWLDVTAPPRHLALAAPCVALGRPARWMARSGYRSGRSPRLELELDGPLVVDGETLPLDRPTSLSVTADDQMRIVTCRRGVPRQRGARDVAASP